MNNDEINFFKNLILPERVKSLYLNNRRYSKNQTIFQTNYLIQAVFN